ncbi:MAG: hypothetical protein ACSLEL_02530 [Candidatus Malihini olakiniferum]
MVCVLWYLATSLAGNFSVILDLTAEQAQRGHAVADILFFACVPNVVVILMLLL